jgi:hypothetical protein
VLGWLRSCYSTQAQLVPGGPPVDIDWWFTPPGAPVIPHHYYGSRNWAPSPEFDGLVGELPDTFRIWRDGSRPDNACGGQDVVVNCCPRPVSPVLYLTLSLDPPLSWAINAPSGSATWTGISSQPIGTCGVVQAKLDCEEILEGGQFVFVWQLRLFHGTSFATGCGSAGFNPSPADSPLTLTGEVVGLSSTCAVAGGAPVPVLISESPPGRSRLGLPLC